MSTITMVECKAIMIECFEKNEPLLILGKPGMGKTAMTEGLTSELDIGFIDFRLSLRDPVDVGGMRIPDMTTYLLKHCPPEDLPLDPKRFPKRGIILFDEINVVSQLLQATAYGIIQERRIGQFKLLPGWVPMGSGNLVTDRAAAQRISTALANRFCIQYPEPDLPSWLDQYGSEHVDTRGTAFLRFRPELFHCMPGQEIRIDTKTQVPVAKDEIRFPSARSWTKAFKFIDSPPKRRHRIFTGYVGETAADEFEAYWRILENAPDPDQIIADPKGAHVPDPSDVGTCYAVAAMLARMADRKNFDSIMVYTDRLPRDYKAAMVADATGRNPGLRNTKAYGNWAVQNQDVLI